jgi:hypothetical protein
VPSDATHVFIAVWGTTSGDVWALDDVSPSHSDGFRDGGATFERQQGSEWTSVTKKQIGRIWTGFSLTATDVWIGGEATTRGDATGFLRFGQDSADIVWSGASACDDILSCTPKIRSIWGTDVSTLWAVGNDGQAFRADGPDGGVDHLTLQNTHTRNGLESIWGSSANDVWAVGQLGTILHTSQSPGTWDRVESQTSGNLHSVWGSGPNDVWAVGDDGTVVHFDGQSWSPASVGWPAGQSPTHLFSVWGSGPDDVWIVGQGVILHRTATSRRQP